jgi:hypothetical protein
MKVGIGNMAIIDMRMSDVRMNEWGIGIVGRDVMKKLNVRILDEDT